MVSIVLVSHSYKLAEGLLHELRMFSKNCHIAIAGGDDNNEYGTSFTKIKNAIEEIYSDDGVCIIADIGSSIMSSEMVIEELKNKNIKILDTPFLEGSIAAVMSCEQGMSLDQIVDNVPLRTI